ncbi:MAG TPA: extracellular solute-binding protein [Aestuariivirgaceae bacterium]|nr:extracellular solute-binding protein [Aestuariivirgaceae bacterium]
MTAGTYGQVHRTLLLAAVVLHATAIETRADGMAELVAAARKEGTVNTIALPRDWCGYGKVIARFTAKYGIAVNELDPAEPADAIAVLRAAEGNTADVPDVIDVGLSAGPSAKAEGLLEPYKVATWSSIPDALKDADGSWHGNYFGVVAFEVNTDIVKTLPADWSDLLKSEYRNSVALAGNPLTSNQAIQSIHAAGIGAGGEAGVEAAAAGLGFFAKLRKVGNLVPAAGTATSLAEGTTPIVIRWDYNALADRLSLKGRTGVAVVIPRSGAVGQHYIMAVTAAAPHPNAARLLLEYMSSDEGQLGWLAGNCHPVRYRDLVRRGKIPQGLAARLPPADAYDNVIFPPLDRQAAAKDLITRRWNDVVGVDIE